MKKKLIKRNKTFLTKLNKENKESGLYLWESLWTNDSYWEDINNQSWSRVYSKRSNSKQGVLETILHTTNPWGLKLKSRWSYSKEQQSLGLKLDWRLPTSRYYSKDIS